MPERFESRPLVEEEKPLEGWEKLKKDFDATVIANTEKVKGMFSSAMEKLRDKKLESERARAAAEQIGEQTVRYIRDIAKFSLLLGMGAAEVENNYDGSIVREVVGENGDTYFSHPDEETMRIIDELTGKPMTAEEQLAAARRKIESVNSLNALSKTNVNLPENFDEMTRQEIEIFVAEHPALLGSSSISDLFPTHHGNNGQFDEETYNIIWKMEKEFGAPKIRWGDRSGQDLTRAHYNFETHTMYLSYPSSDFEVYDSLIAEMAHAKQATENPVLFRMQKSDIALAVQARALKEGKTWREVYDAHEYDTEGSIEYNAHKIIEPELEERLDEARAKDEARRLQQAKNTLDAASREG